MRNFIAMIAATLLALCVATPADADVSKLKPGRGVSKVDLRPYTQVTVVDFTDKVKKRPEDAAEAQQYQEIVAQAGQRFAQLLIDKLSEAKVFTSVAKGTGSDAGGGIAISGTITEFRDSNLGLRYLGFGAGTRFGAEMELRDLATGKVIATAKGKFTGSVIPGAVNFVESIERFMDGVAVRFSDEILIAKGAKFREEIGRSGRLREKYGD